LNLYRRGSEKRQRPFSRRLASRDASRDQSHHANAPANPTANGQCQALLIHRQKAAGDGRTP
jgi:hypothetical protein